VFLFLRNIKEEIPAPREKNAKYLVAGYLILSHHKKRSMDSVIINTIIEKGKSLLGL
jgi:hypothetical protein